MSSLNGRPANKSGKAVFVQRYSLTPNTAFTPSTPTPTNISYLPPLPCIVSCLLIYAFSLYRRVNSDERRERQHLPWSSNKQPIHKQGTSTASNNTAMDHTYTQYGSQLCVISTTRTDTSQPHSTGTTIGHQTVSTYRALTNGTTVD
jgi:hypothetical protein